MNPFRTKLLKIYFVLALYMIMTAWVRTANARVVAPQDEYIQDLDELSALWSFYKHDYIRAGQVISADEHGITTSEGQGYALLRSVWANDPETFGKVWAWTRSHLQVRTDHLFAWKWKGKVLESNAATDADTDIALALILASRKFRENDYYSAALPIIRDIWKYEVLIVHHDAFVTAGNWAAPESYPTIHTAYLAPYAYEIFADVDGGDAWLNAKTTSYKILNWIFTEKKLSLPPTVVYVDRTSGMLMLTLPSQNQSADFSYDAFPIYWRVALDSYWFGTFEGQLRQNMLRFFRDEWQRRKSFFDKYKLNGEPLSVEEGLPLYSTIHSLAWQEGEPWAEELKAQKLNGLWKRALRGVGTPYYLHNWLWFDQAFHLKVTRHFDEFLGFLRPFDYLTFSNSFPWVLFVLMLMLFALAKYSFYCRVGFVALAGGLCLRYLGWRMIYTLNFIEPMGPIVSLGFWLAEVYCFSTVVLLLVQVGLRKPDQKRAEAGAPEALNFCPTVDIYIPIFSEPLSILRNTLIAAMNIEYPRKRIFVCDDSHQTTVKDLAESLGATYLKGPKKHAKAGNMNNALANTSGELILIFDTDHIPAATFLRELVPFFTEPKMGMVQTPHHFYNDDIFQRAFLVRDGVPNDQDMFGHAIQAGRASWGGAFFVGSGALFRRTAIESVGGFNTMSITEDIHTSQHLHAKGWLSEYANKDLAFGLTAENFASYLVQRRRWMLGCMQIFFKDNPLFLAGLSLRQRVGYFASLYYFFFPVVRTVFLFTPMAFLLFHWHPMFADVSVLMGYLIPFMVGLPLLSSVLLPSWPRMFWGTIYENAISIPLARSMFDLFLPKNLGFRVTPKGIVSETRTFDFQSSKLTLIVAGLMLFAIAKGYSEFAYFQIEKDAYFFNLGWAVFNLLSIAMALFVAWEKPQRRSEERLKFALPVEFRAAGGEYSYSDKLMDISLSGVGLMTREFVAFPRVGEIILKDGSELHLPVEVVYNERHAGGSFRVGMKFTALDEKSHAALLLHLFGNAKHWEDSHNRRARTNFGNCLELARALINGMKGTLARPTEERENATKSRAI